MKLETKFIFKLVKESLENERIDFEKKINLVRIK